MKRKFVCLFAVSFAILLMACGSKVPQINDMIKELSEGKEITQKQLDTLFADYEALSDSEKEKIKDYETLEKYKDVNIDTVKEFQHTIDGVTDETKFSNLLEIKEDYDSLTQNEKKLVDFSEVEKRLELNDMEKAALEAAKNVKSCMKSEDSFKVKKLSVKDDLDKMNFYWVLIEYSGDNSFGVSLDSTSCFGITEEFEDPFFPLAQLTGIQKYLDGTTSYVEYVKCDKEEVEIDTDKIQYFLEE